MTLVRTVETNSITLSVTEAGRPDGPPVLLLHGFPDSALMWQAQIEALAHAGRRVIAPDLRGFGASSRPTEVRDYRMSTLVGDVTGLLDALEIEQADVVGHDWGAGLAWAVASRAAPRVRRLAVLSVGHPLARVGSGLDQVARSWYMLWFLFPGVAEQVLPADDWAFLREWAWSGVGGSELDRQIADLSRPGALTAALNWYRANIDPVTMVAPDDSRAAQLRIGCPTMGIWSDGDPFLGEAQMTASAQFVDGPWRYERIEGVDHWLPVRAPELISRLLLEFLDQPVFDA